MCIKGRVSPHRSIFINIAKLGPLFSTPNQPFLPTLNHFVQKWLKPCHRIWKKWLGWFLSDQNAFPFFISASLIAMKKVSPSQSPSPSAIEDTQSTQNSNMYSIQAQNLLLPNIIVIKNVYYNQLVKGKCYSL